jgi:hypothetical protein
VHDRRETRPELMPGTPVRNGDFAGVVVARETTRTAAGPHREIHVRYPDDTVSIHVNDERDHLEAL